MGRGAGMAPDALNGAAIGNSEPSGAMASPNKSTFSRMIHLDNGGVILQQNTQDKTDDDNEKRTY
jgi:hypothetical protein